MVRRPVLRRPVPMSVERAVVDALGLEEEDGVVVLDRGDQQPLGVVGGGRDHRLDAGDVGEDAFGALAVRLPAEDAAAVRGADGDGRGEVTRRSVAQPRRLADELVEAGIDVVGELDLGHGPQPVRAHADGRGDDAAFVDGRVEHARLAELRLQAGGRAEHAAEIADVFPHHDHVRVAGHGDLQRGVDRLDHVHAAGGGGLRPSRLRLRHAHVLAHGRPLAPSSSII